jgi:hypothetical protein
VAAVKPRLTEYEALAEALLFLRGAPKDDRLHEVSFGRYADGSGAYWSMRLVTEVMNGEVRPSPEDDRKKTLEVIHAWKKLFDQTGEDDEPQ